ncbi:hypothetical protein [Pseudomonas sp. SCA2728.1_7]|uniref:carboxymuconolactone decarboxylase family protein n=1 Tax=Pseudomonas sp. SCA2728.1_7 TaxID=2825975 RepID=UPI001BAF1EA6|nr:hypothetical protein [Pseudomonas sp. SCA2728.1_7]QUE90437.1 hypothetical protein KBP52_28145 [Pseudomonas sp. SCA2728.1_7]
MNQVQSRKQRGIADMQGHETIRAIPTDSALLTAGATNQMRISGEPVQRPVINQLLQAHLFGDIFERDNLDWQSLELTNVGALATKLGAEAQLCSHLRAGLRPRLSPAQLQQVIECWTSTRAAFQCSPYAGARSARRLIMNIAKSMLGIALL